MVLDDDVWCADDAAGQGRGVKTKNKKKGDPWRVG